jgi:hypothetical protein
MKESASGEHCVPCHCACHKFNGFMVALIGLTFLLKAFNVLADNVVNITWPILVMLIGLKKSLLRGKCQCCDKAKCE